jgi:hypothetical protein
VLNALALRAIEGGSYHVQASLCQTATWIVDEGARCDPAAATGLPDLEPWVVVWFVLGYAIYATAYGAFGSLASRTEDAASIAAPVTTLLIVAYWASLAAVGGDPESGWAVLASFVPVTSPFAMPGRVALGVAAWWEPFAAAALALVAIAAIVTLAGRVYSGAILRTGGTVKLREAWSGPASRRRSASSAHRDEPAADRSTQGVLVVIAVAAGGVAYAVGRDVVLGVGVGAGTFAVATRVLKARRRRDATHLTRAE